MNSNNTSEFRHHIAKSYLKGFKSGSEPLYVYCYKTKNIMNIGLANKILGEMNFYTSDTEIFLNEFETKFAMYRDSSESNLNSLIMENPILIAKIISIFFLRSKYQKEFWFELSKQSIKNKKPIEIPLENFSFATVLLGNKKFYIEPSETKQFDYLVQDTFESEIKNKDNNIIQFIQNSIKNNMYVILNGSYFVTSETPIIVLDKNNNFIKFESAQDIEQILFSLTSSVRICFFRKIFEPMLDWFDIFIETLSMSYSNFIISSNKIYLEDKLKKYKLEIRS